MAISSSNSAVNTPLHRLADSFGTFWTKKIVDVNERQEAKSIVILNIKLIATTFASAGIIAMLAITVFSGLSLIWGAIGIGLFVFLQTSGMAELKQYNISENPEDRIAQLETKTFVLSAEGVRQSLGLKSVPKNWNPVFFQLGNYITFYRALPLNIKPEEQPQAVKFGTKVATLMGAGKGASDEQQSIMPPRFKAAPGVERIYPNLSGLNLSSVGSTPNE